MARRIEITVPTDFRNLVIDCLDDPKRGDLLSFEGHRPGFYVELPGPKFSMFLVTLPGPQVGPLLEILKKIGVGNIIGHISLATFDCIKPNLTKPPSRTIEQEEKVSSKTKGPSAFRAFQTSKLTTEEIYNNIYKGADMNINTWFNLIGACLIAGGGLTTNSTIFIVAAMLVSPIMGPILGMVFGYRIADWKLFKMGLQNCIKMACTAFACGILISMILGNAHNTYMWPTPAMAVNDQYYNLAVSCVVSGAAGMVLGVSVTVGGVNSLVGTAISAGLLPPIVNSGMLYTYAFTYAKIEQRAEMLSMAGYHLEFFSSHVFVIFVVANTIFYLKEINPRFKDTEDVSFVDYPTLLEYNRSLSEQDVEGGESKGESGVGAGAAIKKNFLVRNTLHELEEFREKFDKGIEKMADAKPLAALHSLPHVFERMRATSMSRKGSVPVPMEPSLNEQQSYSHAQIYEETRRDFQLSSEFINNPLNSDSVHPNSGTTVEQAVGHPGHSV